MAIKYYHFRCIEFMFEVLNYSLIYRGVKEIPGRKAPKWYTCSSSHWLYAVSFHLVPIQRNDNVKITTTGVRFSLLNVRSVRNKALIVKDYVVDNDIDVLAITETWLRPGDHDAVEIGTLCPTGYRFMHVPRLSSRGGGIGLLFKDSLRINDSLCNTFQSFEIMDVRLRNVECVRILIIYRSPDSSNVFYEEFSRLLEQVSAEHSGHLLITGDLNFHVDNPNNSNAKRFVDLLEAFDLKQHVCGKTHHNGQTLDVVVTRSNDSLIRGVKVMDPVISDHYAVHCDLLMKKPQFAKKVVSFRKLRSIDIDSFCENIKNSPLLQQQAPDLETLVNQYDNVLKSLLDKHAPVMQRRVTIRPSAPWYTQEVALAKNKRRRLERKWYSTRLQSDRELYVYQCSVANNLITSLKSDYYTSIINEHAADQRVLFKTVNKLLQQSTEKHYPLSPDNVTLANSFADFFMNKIDKIRCSTRGKQPSDPLPPSPMSALQSSGSSLRLVKTM